MASPINQQPAFGPQSPAQPAAPQRPARPAEQGGQQQLAGLRRNLEADVFDPQDIPTPAPKKAKAFHTPGTK